MKFYNWPHWERPEKPGRSVPKDGWRMLDITVVTDQRVELHAIGDRGHNFLAVLPVWLGASSLGSTLFDIFMRSQKFDTFNIDDLIGWCLLSGPCHSLLYQDPEQHLDAPWRRTMEMWQ